jgi:hypothetical protein
VKKMEEQDPSNPSEAPVPLNYGGYDPTMRRPKVALPLIGGLVLGGSVIAVGGVFAAISSNRPSPLIIVFAAIFVVVAGLFATLVRRLPRTSLYWFKLGLLLGIGVASLAEGICFTVAST